MNDNFSQYIEDESYKPNTKQIQKMIEHRNKRMKQKNITKFNCIQFVPVKSRILNFKNNHQDFQQIFAEIKHTFKQEYKSKSKNKKHYNHDSFLGSLDQKNKCSIFSQTLTIHKLNENGKITQVKLQNYPATHRTFSRNQRKINSIQNQRQKTNRKIKTQTQNFDRNYQLKTIQNHSMYFNQNEIKFIKDKQKLFNHNLKSESAQKDYPNFKPMHSLRKIDTQNDQLNWLPVKSKYILMKFSHYKSRVKTDTSGSQTLKQQSIKSKKIKLKTRWVQTPGDKEKNTPIAPW